MPTAISPYRYYQVAHYLLRRFIDQTTFLNNPKWKGKGKAISMPTLSSMNTLLKSTAVEARRTWDDMVPSESYAESSATGANRGKGVYLPPNSSPNRDENNQTKVSKDRSEIYRLMNDQRLLDPRSVKPPREVVVLCHGEYKCKVFKDIIGRVRAKKRIYRTLRFLNCNSNTSFPFT